MKLLELTLPTPEENIALDEALLEEAETGVDGDETLRLWEPDRLTVVVGRSSRVPVEVRTDECRRRGIAVLRRISGGAAVVTGRGCLMYAVVLSMKRRPELRMIETAHRFVLETIAGALRPLAPSLTRRGISDLALGPRKCSGNSLRVKRHWLLYHGTLLYDFPLEEIDRLLAMPPRQPDYRQGRLHGRFVGNLPLDRQTLARCLISACAAGAPRSDWPQPLTAALVATRYGLPEWNALG
jgi:lipoate-protein ligase A